VFTAVLAAAVLAGCSDEKGSACELEDQDGIIGGQAVFVLRVANDGFDPVILQAQNRSDVTLTLENQGTGEAGFSVDCLPTPNQDGCATESCFPAASTIAPIAPGETGTASFRVPDVEGEYKYRAAIGDDVRIGQFIVD
jgi:hypothetical protein